MESSVAETFDDLEEIDLVLRSRVWAHQDVSRLRDPEVAVPPCGDLV
jgi:hypothetical protein